MVLGIAQNPALGLGKAPGVIGAGTPRTFTGCEKNFPLVTRVAHSAKWLRRIVDAKVDRVIDPLPDFHVYAHGGEGTLAASHVLGGICAAW